SAKPTTGTNVSEHEARAVAEASRETSWSAPSFVRELFLGRLELGLLHPHPEPDPEEQRRARSFTDALERFLRDEVDPEQIEHDARVAERVIHRVGELGALFIEIPRESGGVGLAEDSYG